MVSPAFTPGLDPLFTIDIVAGAGTDFGPSPSGRRVFAPIVGGRFEGPRLRGVVAPAGGDWPTVVAPGQYHLDVRAHLVTDQGSAILMTYAGRWIMTPEVAARAFDPQRAEGVGVHEHYYRTAVVFQTGAPDCLWLNDLVAVGVGRKTPQGVTYDVFAVT